MTQLGKNTTLCMSLSARPSDFGTRFHNFLYSELGLDYIYKAFTTNDLAAAIGGIRALGIRGCGVSMPYKTECLALLDGVDPAAADIGAVNTIVNTDHHLVGYNTDYLAVSALLNEAGFPTDAEVVLLGSGGMALAVTTALDRGGFRRGTVVARNPESGPALARRLGYAWQADADALHPQVLINATPIGMADGPAGADLPCPDAMIDGAEFVMDVVAFPPTTALVSRARNNSAAVIDGSQIVALQAIEQFALYTGVRPSPEQAARAAVFASS